ncbi:hypothetical protein PAXRUDRAFT_19482 [Paxillus rubicundulus Ve08.2h10]|uniref:Zn(2)-C6 fungal-type domain-containing protein n=1 Tax=Paxillus rubicundulus Ve08.2h10 TaxID=930991 RepID=A0A0D0DC59_9AGAM|nr:hypothetical protein PAXRUDRAFT_19482 [Paxillus rubicundulus Ve08.2h10]
MSSSTTNNLTKWSDEQLRENEDDNNELFEKKSAECRRRTKARKEAERRMAEEVARRKAEEEAKRKVEVEAQRRAEVRAEEVARVQSLTSGLSKGKQPRVMASGTAEVAESVGGLAPCYGCSDLGVACEMRAAGSSKARSCDRCRRLRNKCEWPGDAQPSRRRKREEVMSPRAGKKKAWTKSPAVEDDDDDVEDCEAEENRDTLGTLAEVLSVMVGELRNMAVDRRRMAAESHAQMERVLGTLEEIRGCLDPEFVPEEGSEENFDEGEVAEAAEEREALKGWNEEEEEVDESV